MNNETIRSKDDYYALFSGAQKQRAVGESSVFYLYYPGTAERIQRELPDVKLLVMLRNPVNRAFSAYMHLIRDNREHLSFKDSLKQEEKRKESDFEPMWLYRELGLYTEQIERYLQVFDKRQMKFILFEDFTARTQDVLKDVLTFLEVDPDVPIDTSLQHNESGVPKNRWLYDFISKPHGIKELVKPLIPQPVRERIGIRAKSMTLRKESMPDSLRQELKQYFRPDIQKLEDLIERDMSVWLNK
ncbi:sulfotransferase [Alicyclobacillus tolerans]|uniref:sulfotransferase domain-containing protein n=1 Tax=Alicyclobacillus tolerans TaxID=90970 RepID=UPI001F43EAEC|nr:sulfotransferase domain-containing protein [Alicyclobacillus tolerans]MCF8565915.1 sulfotransferase [Alicyclobacillus tolerans]